MSANPPAPDRRLYDLCLDGAVTVEDALAFTGIDRTTLYEHMAAGRLVYVQPAKRWLIPRRALAALLATFPAANLDSAEAALPPGEN